MSWRSWPSLLLYLLALLSFGCERTRIPEQLTLFYSLSCHACYEGAHTQELLKRTNALRGTLSETRIEIVDIMTPGNLSRLRRMVEIRGVDVADLVLPVLLCENEVIVGFAEIDGFLSRLK